MKEVNSSKKKLFSHDLQTKQLTIGWREWVSFPQLGIPAIKAKIDTGARTSAIHAFNIKHLVKDGIPHVKFDIKPLQDNNRVIKTCCLPILNERVVTSSNGQKEERITVQTPVLMGGVRWPIDITLTNRDFMSFRMLLGRQAMKFHAVIPRRSFLLGRHNPKKAESLYFDPI